MQNKPNTFEAWNTKKQIIHKKRERKHFKERDIVFINIGENIGSEQNGKRDEFLRPVIICKKFSSETFLGIPLTSVRKNNRFYVSFEFKEKISTAILSQVRLFDAKYGRLLSTTISKNDGRYGFLVGDNKYLLNSTKKGYILPEGKVEIEGDSKKIVKEDLGMKKSKKQ